VREKWGNPLHVPIPFLELRFPKRESVQLNRAL
jgi:hypothetical protein